MSKVEKLYRYERWSTSEEFHPSIILETYNVESYTNSGFWIRACGKKKWVSNNTRNRFAYPTKLEAWNNFNARTKRCIEIMTIQLNRAKRFYELSKAEPPTQ